MTLVEWLLYPPDVSMDKWRVLPHLASFGVLFSSLQYLPLEISTVSSRCHIIRVTMAGPMR
jgi:hypothetical protein